MFHLKHVSSGQTELKTLPDNGWKLNSLRMFGTRKHLNCFLPSEKWVRLVAQIRQMHICAYL